MSFELFPILSLTHTIFPTKMHSNIPLVVVIAAWVSLATTHVVEEYPPPFRFLEYGPTNPIDPTGSNFPCKVPEGSHLQLDGEPTVMAIGEEQYVSFSGKAVHGGGSCQLALSGPVSDGFEKYDLATAKWKVIHSIEGGCPARHQPGNLDGPNKDKYPFKIPEGIEPGNHIFSWTVSQFVVCSYCFFCSVSPPIFITQPHTHTPINFRQ